MLFSRDDFAKSRRFREIKPISHFSTTREPLQKLGVRLGTSEIKMYHYLRVPVKSIQARQ